MNKFHLTRPSLQYSTPSNFTIVVQSVYQADKLTSQPTNGGTEVIGRRTSTTFLILEKMLDIWQVPRKHNIALKCGIGSGLFVLNVNNRGDFVPNLKPGKYGVAHTAIGNAIRQTKRIIDGSSNTSAIFGIYPDESPEGLTRRTLLRQTDLFGRGTISLLADGAYALIEPSIHAHTGQSYRFYTPFKHELELDLLPKVFRRSAYWAKLGLRPCTEVRSASLHALLIQTGTMALFMPTTKIESPIGEVPSKNWLSTLQLLDTWCRICQQGP